MAKATPLTFYLDDPEGILDAIWTLEQVRDMADHRIASLRAQLARRVLEPSAPDVDATTLARAMWSALSDRGVLRIDADSPKELDDIATSVLAAIRTDR